MRALWLAPLWLVSATPIAAKPYSLDDMLSARSYGKAVFDPHGNWAVLERYRPYETAAAYHFDAFNKRMLGQIMRVDLAGDGQLTELFPQSDAAGYWVGSASPDGTRLSVFRLSAERLELGIVDMKSSQVRWLPVNPVTALLNPIPIWRDNRRLLVIASQRQGLSYPLDIGSRLQRGLPALWRRSATGKEAGVSVVESRAVASAGHFEQRQVLEIDVVTHASRLITNGTIVDMALSADARALSVTEEQDDRRPQRDALVAPSDRPREHRIRILSLGNGLSRSVCAACDTMPGLMRWANEEAMLLFFARNRGDAWSAGRLHVFDARSGRSQDIQGTKVHPWLPEDDTGAQIIRAGWQGRKVLVLSRQADGTLNWEVLTADRTRLPALPCQPVQLFGTGDTLLVPCPDGLWQADKVRAARRIGKGPVRLDQSAQETFDVGISFRYAGIFETAGRSVTISSVSGQTRVHALDDLRGAGAAMPSRASRLLGYSSRSQKGLAISQSENGASGLWLLRATDAPIQIDAINTHLDAVELPRALALPATRDGTVHWLFLPGGAQPDRSLPLVIMPYPGTVFPRGGAAPITPDAVASAVNPLLVTGLGYAALIPSMPHDRDAGEPSRELTRLIESAADAALASGYIDPSRMAVYGHSFGGYSALVVAAGSQRFCGIVAGASAPDLTLQHGQFAPYDQVHMADGFPLGSSFGWAESGQARLKVAPWQDSDRFLRNSPYYSLQAIRTPVLLIHGDLDPIAAMGPERMFSGLYRTGGDVTLLRYWGEGHVIRSPANIRDMWRFLAGWLSNQAKCARNLRKGQVLPPETASRATPG